jgi:Uncharacterized protein conserved in bacteria
MKTTWSRGLTVLATLALVSGTGTLVARADGPATAGSGSAPAAASSTQSGKGAELGKPYSQDETLKHAEDFFGGTSKGLAQTIAKAFNDNGQPDAYVTGNEGAGAFIVGLRYGAGTLHYKGGGSMPIYWEGPSIGWDFGGNASKTFMLIYNLHWTNDLFQRFPGVDGSLYLVAGVGINYLRADGITIAPIRTGVGLRAGASVGYMSFSHKRDWNPF